MPRFCATAATPAVRQLARPASTSSTGVAPLVLGREDLRVVGLERELGPVLLLLAEPVEAVDVRAAVRALLPLARGPPREFRRLGRLAQSFTRLEQGAYVDTVVHRRRHGEISLDDDWSIERNQARDHSPASPPVSKLAAAVYCGAWPRVRMTTP